MVVGYAVAAVAAAVGLAPATVVAATGVGRSAAEVAAPPKIVSFWLVNATSGHWLRRLYVEEGFSAEDSVDVDAVGPFTIAAAPVAGRRGATPDAVIFTSPEQYAHVERVRPFLLAGEDATGRPRGVALPVGTYTVTAFATAVGGGGGRAPTAQGNPVSLRLTLFHGRRRPPVGALAGDLAVPPRPAGCSRLPNVSDTEGHSVDDDVAAWAAGWSVHYCSGARFRWRLFAAPLGTSSPPWRLRQSLIRVDPAMEKGYPTGVPESGLVLRRSCTSQAAWSEVCVSIDGVPACTAGGVGVFTALPPPEVTLESPSPPRGVDLAPGDAIVLTTRLKSHRDNGNQGDGDGPALRMVGVVRRLDGTARRSEAVTSGTVLVNRLLSTGVTVADDGATAYVEVSRLSCPPEGAAVAIIGRTRLTVSPDTAPLVRPDTAPPSVPVISFPPTGYGNAANVSAAATNAGGGYRMVRRRGRKVQVPTTLSWQWSMQRFSHGIHMKYNLPDVLVGQTGPVLFVPAVGCDSMLFCRRGGCPRRRLYTVEACNTAGCVRSAPVAPVVRRPVNAGRAQWLEDNKGCWMDLASGE